jgi:hypothetical protein
VPTGQCKVDPVSGVAGDIFNAWTGDGDAGLHPQASVSGSTMRKLTGAMVEAIAAEIFGSIGAAPTLWDVQSKSLSFSAQGYAAEQKFVHYRIDTSGGAVTVTLPTATSGWEILFKKFSSDNNNVNFTSGTIDGDASLFFKKQWTALHVRGNGSTWDVI